MYKKTKADLEIDVQDIRKAALLIRALNHPVRQSILKTMARHKRIAVTVLCRKLKRPQADISMHLAVLRRMHLVSVRPEGKHRFYGVNRDHLQQLSHAIEKFIS